MKTKDMKHPIQPVGWNEDEDVIRFKENKIVSLLLETSRLDLNALAIMRYQGKVSDEDYTQLMQLIGYSVSKYGGLSTSPPDIVKKADKFARILSRGKEIIEEAQLNTVDRMYSKCSCGGTFQETTFFDDMDGKLHCNKCGNEIKRWGRKKRG